VLSKRLMSATVFVVVYIGDANTIVVSDAKVCARFPSLLTSAIKLKFPRVRTNNLEQTSTVSAKHGH